MSVDRLAFTNPRAGVTSSPPKTKQRPLGRMAAKRAILDKLPLWEWTKPRSAILHPGGNRNRVLCEGCGKTLSTFPESIDPEPCCCEDEINGISLYWCAKCTDNLEAKLDREHAAQVAADLRARRREKRR